MKTLSVAHSACTRILPAIVLIGSLIGFNSASAAVFTWAGAAGNWGTNGSWLNNAQPANNDSVLFTSAGSGTTSTVNLSRTISDITFNASANRTFTLQSSGTFTTTLGSLVNDSGA